jgi:hypothetical protein
MDLAPKPLTFPVSLDRPRTLPQQASVTAGQACTSCGARSGHDCRAAGLHLARWYSAHALRLITDAEFAMAREEAGSNRADAVVPGCESCKSPGISRQRQTADCAVWHCKACLHTWTVPVTRKRPG